MSINRYKHIRRYKEIARVFVKHGFGTVLDQLGILKYLDIKKKTNKKEDKYIKKSIGERLRLALEELGPSFIKLGQIISTRQDLLSEDIIKELEKLHESALPFSFEEAKECIEYELGENLEEIFIEFDEKPLAAASISQVHLAKLKSGKQVVVKIQRPRIEIKIEEDMKILKDLAWFIDTHTKYGKLYEFSTMVKEFHNTLRKELDFRIEGEYTEKFKENLASNRKIVIPSVYWECTTRSILTLEYIEGISLSNFEELKDKKVDLKLIARIISKSIFEQILRDGLYHGDPHPGNIKALSDNKIAFLDFGMVGTLKEERKRQFLKILLGIAFKNSKLIVDAVMDLGSMTRRSDAKKLEFEIDKLRDEYIELPLKEIKLTEIFNKIFDLSFKYNIKIPNEFTMLVKTLATMEGVVEKLDPELNVLEIAQPIAKKLMFRLFSPETVKDYIKEGIFDYGNLVKEFPELLLNFFRKMEDEDYTLNFRFKSTKEILKRFDKISNKISFSIALLSLSIIIAGFIIGFGMAATVETEAYIFNLSILKIGLVAAVLMYLWLIFSIFKTGRF
ncbi:ABC1 kinase family protein [Maledivibacter halophilus]|uniref:2-octaprenylphenol hydroxylase n=1 Tax=Maledivibacter halophilus TaxID=36842 RepID=A0A1T5LK01_9FIRM|nr:AarF/UbiB family protein [Maledivibacter halophilus]SKC76323.1 2-octaprenylphenol hydroxylase [Maledivibacter halophilus]